MFSLLCCDGKNALLTMFWDLFLKFFLLLFYRYKSKCNLPPVTAAPNGCGTSALGLNWLYGAKGARLKGVYD